MKFKDRFNRPKLIACSLPIKYNKLDEFQSHWSSRDNLPSSFWLDGNILWINANLERHCITGPSISMIDGDLGYAVNDITMTKMEWLLAIE